MDEETGDLELFTDVLLDQSDEVDAQKAKLKVVDDQRKQE
jgi:hypothetical protein